MIAVTDAVTEFWGEPISVYTDAQALDDGFLVDSCGVFPAAWKLNRVTSAVWSTYTRKLLNGAMTDITLVKRALTDAWANAKEERGWRIGKTADGKTIWFVPNEVDGMTAMFPEDY